MSKLLAISNGARGTDVLPLSGHAENRVEGLFEAEPRYNLNEHFAADLL
jgi:hypothetical protein